jgi:hypothetical protein
MKTKQAIYVINRNDFDRAFLVARSGWAYGPYFGTITCAEDWNAMRDEIAFDANDQVLISKVMEAINARFSWKLIAGDRYGRPRNGALVFLKRQINYCRKPKDV